MPEHSRGGNEMEADNFDSTLTAFKRRSPFRPFTVALVNGDRFEVDYPDALVVGDGVAVYIGAGAVPVLFDHEAARQVIGDLMDQTYPQRLVRRCAWTDGKGAV